MLGVRDSCSIKQGGHVSPHWEDNLWKNTWQKVQAMEMSGGREEGISSSKALTQECAWFFYIMARRLIWLGLSEQGESNKG